MSSAKQISVEIRPLCLSREFSISLIIASITVNLKMRPIFFTLLVVLWTCDSSNGNQLIDQNIGNNTQFTDLNDDVLYIIFYRIGLTNLINLAEINPRLQDLADQVIQSRYRQKTLSIDLKLPRTQSCEETENKVTIYDFDLALEVFKYFGSYFRWLEFLYRSTTTSDADLERFFEFLNKYCSKSLVRLDMEFMQDLFEKFTYQFEAIEELKIRSNLDTFPETRPLNKTFPNLRRFTLYSRLGTVYSFKSIKFKRLEYFAIDGNDLNDSKNNEFVKEIIRLNPTIRSLDLKISDRTLAKFISLHLPTLENLTIHHLGNDTVEFLNLRSLNYIDIDKDNFDSIEKLSMPRLESLKAYFNLAHSNKWKQFFNKYSQLRRLHIEESSYVNFFNELRNVDQVVSSLVNLTDVEFGMLVEHESLIRLLQNHKKLNRCRISELLSGDEKQMYRDRLGNAWKCDFKKKNFERKKPILN